MSYCLQPNVIVFSSLRVFIGCLAISFFWCSCFLGDLYDDYQAHIEREILYQVNEVVPLLDTIAKQTQKVDSKVFFLKL